MGERILYYLSVKALWFLPIGRISKTSQQSRNRLRAHTRTWRTLPRDDSTRRRYSGCSNRNADDDRNLPAASHPLWCYHCDLLQWIREKDKGDTGDAIPHRYVSWCSFDRLRNCGNVVVLSLLPLGGADGGYTILGGALTMVVILLPVIIRSTEEALMTVPQDLRQGSLALGANQTQTILKIVIPSALPGILTAVLLSIGRIIGESAALILVSGTVINDRPRLNQGGATLAVAIWKEMAGEQPNIRVAASISVLIIIIVLILNVLVKLTSRRLKRT